MSTPFRIPHRATLYAVLLPGLLLWGITFGYNRPIFLDEANLARNLYDQSWAGLFRPLDHEQDAPPLYLLFTKLLAECFGYREWVLRLPALLGGLLAGAMLVRAGRYLKLGGWAMLPLALMFVNPTVLRYVTEFKPYGLDLGLAALLIAWELSPYRDKKYAWLGAGIVLPWLSLPSVFVLAAVGLRHLRRDITWLWLALAWLVSFACLYVIVLRPSIGSQYLNNFHARYFMPLPLNAADVRQMGVLTHYLLRLMFGFTIAALVTGVGIFVTGLSLASVRDRHGWLLVPLLLVVAASHLKLYTLIDRLMLFVLPGVWLFAAVTFRTLFNRLGRWSQLALLLAAGLTLGSTNIYRAVARPYRFSDSRALAAVARSEEDTYVADGSAVPVLDYYLRVHPHGSDTVRVRRPDMGGRLPAGDRHVLFDGTNNASTRSAVERYRRQATERRCDADWEPLFRSGVLIVKCP